MKLLTTNNAKIQKGEGKGYLTAGLHLAPYNLSGYNVCQKASPECIAACLNTAGRGVYDNIQEARIRKTQMMFQDTPQFNKLLIADCEELLRKAAREDADPVVRLNLTSDWPWYQIKIKDNKNIMDLFPQIKFYDYTKRIVAVRNKPDNYHLTFSRSENNDRDCFEALANGVNVAIVMSLNLIAQLDQFKGRLRLHCGDNDDLRFLDPSGKYGRIIYLTPKGKARKIKTEGFIMQSLDSLNAFNRGFNEYLRNQVSANKLAACTA